VPILGAATAGASQPVSTLRSKADALAAKIDAIQVKLEVLSEEYDQASTREALLRRDIDRDERSIASTRSTVRSDRQALQEQVIDAYVSDDASSGVFSVLTVKENALPAQQAYLEAAAGNLSTAVTSLRFSEHALVERIAQLGHDEAQSHETLVALGAARANADNLEANLTSTLQGVNGSLAAAVAQQEQQEATEAAARAAAAQLIKQAQSQSDPTASNPAPSSDTVAPDGDASGLAAVRAAESQIGVPYVWGASSPGYGFDCSGLAMWAWGQAGVNLPHSAEDQYYSIEHIPFSELEPGDLIFYAWGGYIYHVVMYIGNGQAISAEETGTRISITPVPPGAYAAGRP
jgi:cell wall-associated NlpC family hydrolase